MLGQFLATANDDSYLFLTNIHTGKVVHNIDCSQYSRSRVSCLGWGINFTESTKVNEQLNKLTDSLTLDDIISRNPQIKSTDNVSDLPMDLAFLDLESLLPKLSPLAPGGIEYVHTSR